MPAFRKRPIIVEAVRVHEPVVVETLEGNISAQAGDWVIKGIMGEIYPCKDNIFRQTYEPVDKDGVKALVAPGPDETEEREYIIPFPTPTSAIA